MLKSLPLERIYRDSRCGSLMLPGRPKSASTGLARRRYTSRAKRTNEPPSGTTPGLGDGRANALDSPTDRMPFAPARRAILCRRELCGVRRSHGGGGARAEIALGVGRGDRVAILATNHPDYLVLLYACARLGAMLVPLNWRLAVPEQVFMLSDAS